MTNQKHCLHCGAPVWNESEPFCCSGCRTVYDILKDRGWDDYYRFRDLDSTDANPVALINEDFEYLDSDAYREQHVHPVKEHLETEWRLDGVTCSACLWLIEKVTRDFPGIQDASIRLNDGRLQLLFKPDTDLRELARRLAQLGYKVNLSGGVDSGRGDLVRLGVSGALAGNLMMFGLPFYVGLNQGLYAHLFGGLQWLLTIALLAYGARPFFQKAWISATMRIFDLDQPISLGLMTAFMVSSYHLFAGEFHQIYFDSMGMLVFFLLLGRYIQKRGVNRAVAVTNRLIGQMPRMVEVHRGSQVLKLPAQQIMPGDIIQLRAAEVVPVDGVLLSPHAQLNLHVVTGESRPVKRFTNDPLPAGAVNLGCAVQMRAESDLASSEVSRLRETSQRIQDQEQQRNDILAGNFLAIVTFFAMLGLAIWLPHGLDRALTVAATVFIVACPCALALARPTAHALALRAAADHGILIKSLDVFDKLPEVREIVFDKTGVLTYGDPRIVQSKIFSGNRRWLESAVVYLEREMQHPLAKAFEDEFTLRLEPRSVNDIQVHAGLGVSGVIDGHRVVVTGVKGLEVFELGPGEAGRAMSERTALKEDAAHVMVFVDGVLAAVYALEDRLRPEIQPMLEAMGQLGLKRSLLSGDTTVCVNRMARGLAMDTVRGQMLPQDKLDYLQTHTDLRPAMVGDGLNDMGALAAAHVGFTHSDATQAALEFADVVFQGRSMDRLETTFNLVNRARHAAAIGVKISLTYNTTAILLTLGGFIGPLTAAVLMALSSISVPAVIAFVFRSGGRRWVS